MNKMKRIFAFLLSVVLAFNVIIVAVAEETTEPNSELLMRCEVLQTLGILEDSYALDKELNRGEFAEYVAKMLSLDSKATSGNAYFNDIPSDSVINTLCEMGIMNGVEERVFAPSEQIELNHAYVALVRALGYKIDGNVATFLKLANTLDINDGVTGDRVTLSNAVVMIFNCLTTNALELNLISVDGAEYVCSYRGKGKTLMEISFKAYYLEGVVTANRFTALYDSDDIENDIIKIDDIKYECQIDSVTELIGRRVCAIVSCKDKNNSKQKVLYISEDKTTTETLVISADAMISYSSGEIKYVQSDKERRVSVDTSMAVIYNGVAVGSKLEECFDIDEGEITLIKNNSSKYSVAVIEEYENIVVNSVENVDNTIYTNGVGLYKAINTKDADYVKIISADSNKAIGVQQLMRGDVLSAMISRDGRIVRLYLNTKAVEGTLETINTSDGDTEVVIGGNKYVASSDITIDNKSLGMNVKYVLDITGKLAAPAFEQPKTEYTLGYMYAGTKNDGAFSSSVKLKIYTYNDEHIIVDCADKVKLDGNSVKEESVLDAIGTENGHLKRNMVLFKLNSDGELIYLDTAAPNKESREAENTLYEMAEKGTHNIDDAYMVIDQKYAIATDAILFGVPFDSNVNPTKQAFDLFKFKTTDNPFESTTDYQNVGIYKYDDRTPYANAITYGIADGSNGLVINNLNEEVMLVDQIVQVYDEKEGEVVNAIQGLSRDKVVEYYVEPEIDLNHVEGFSHHANVPAAYNDNKVESGDAIRFALSSRGYIAGIQLAYDYSEGRGTWYGCEVSPEVNPTKPDNFTNVAQSTANSFQSVGRKGGPSRFVIGYLDDVYFDEVGSSYNIRSAFSVSDTLGGEVQMVLPITSNNNTFMIYDGSRKDNKAYIGTPHDMTTFDADGTKSSKMFVHWRYSTRVSWILYR